VYQGASLKLVSIVLALSMAPCSPCFGRACRRVSYPKVLQTDDRAALTYFLSRTPEEQIRLWEHHWDPTRSHIGSILIDEILVARGPEVVPYLAQVVRGRKGYYQVHALKLLCDMDRFVSQKDLPLPGIGQPYPGGGLIEPLDHGLLNHFMAVDGRRIGDIGYAAVKWAAEQTENKELRFQAREYSGMMEQDLRALPVIDQIESFKTAVTKAKWLSGRDMDSLDLGLLLRKILIAEAPDSIPSLVALLDGKSNRYVRDAALTTLEAVDACRMRLRATPVGLTAIEAMHRALNAGNLAAHSTARTRESTWNWVRGRVFDDDFIGDWTVVAQAFATFYGVLLPMRKDGNRGYSPEANPVMHQFLGYLTRVDPFFPSWEYTQDRGPSDQATNPLFRRKIDRYYEAWKRFQSSASLTLEGHREGTEAFIRFK
jgi:hypothetical protein